MPARGTAEAFLTVPEMVAQTTVTMLEVACSELPLLCAMTALYAIEVAVGLVTVVTQGEVEQDFTTEP
jgi:hypothetical protein